MLHLRCILTAFVAADELVAGVVADGARLGNDRLADIAVGIVSVTKDRVHQVAAFPERDVLIYVRHFRSREEVFVPGVGEVGVDWEVCVKVGLTVEARGGECLIAQLTRGIKSKLQSSGEPKNNIMQQRKLLLDCTREMTYKSTLIFTTDYINIYYCGGPYSIHNLYFTDSVIKTRCTHNAIIVQNSPR